MQGFHLISWLISLIRKHRVIHISNIATADYIPLSPSCCKLGFLNTCRYEAVLQWDFLCRHKRVLSYTQETQTGPPTLRHAQIIILFFWHTISIPTSSFERSSFPTPGYILPFGYISEHISPLRFIWFNCCIDIMSMYVLSCMLSSVWSLRFLQKVTTKKCISYIWKVILFECLELIHKEQVSGLPFVQEHI